MTALVMLLLLVIAAFATDLGAWYRQGQAQQQAADVAALNGSQTYDRAVDAYLDSFGPFTSWSDLTVQQRIDGERQAILATVDTIQTVLETSGYSFSQSAVETAFAIPPHGPPDEDAITQYTLTDDDGAVVTITRSLVQVQGIWVSQITVEIADDGSQFLSGIFRDAPEIVRSATGAVAACGAECEQVLQLDPPFTGFDADGSGDGFQPILVGTQVWAVNHHSNSGTSTTPVGDIVCIDRLADPIGPCVFGGDKDGEFSLEKYHTSTWAEPIHVDGKIYFPATQRLGRNIPVGEAGLVCFDTTTNNYCSGGDEFVGFWPSTGNQRFSSAAGSIALNDNDEIWIVSQFGRLACVTTGMDVCSSGSSSVYDAATQTYEGAADVRNGAQLRNVGDERQIRNVWSYVHETGGNGTELHIMNRARANNANDAIFHCFNLDTREQCWGGISTDANAPATNAAGFPVFDANGAYRGICAYTHGNTTEIGCRSSTCLLYTSPSPRD